MRKITRTRALSLMLTIFMLISTLSVFPVSVGAAEAATEPVIIDMSSFEAASKHLQVFAVPEVPDGINNTFGAGAGIYHFDAEDEALQLHYATEADGSGYAFCNARYRFAMRIRSADTLSASHTFMVVSYRTDTTEKVPLRISDYGSTDITLASDVSVSGGKWVKSTPADISGTNVATRMLNPGSHNALAVNITDASALFQIKEIAFFATEAEANEYAFDPLIYDFTGEPAVVNDFGTTGRHDFDSGVAIYNKTTTNVGACGYYEHDPDNDAAVMTYYASGYSGDFANTHHRFTFRSISSILLRRRIALI